MADMALSETADSEDLRMRYAAGKMSLAEAYDLGLVDHMGYERAPSTSRTCRYCGARGLQWAKTDFGWRLSTNGVVHTCEEYYRLTQPTGK